MIAQGRNGYFVINEAAANVTLPVLEWRSESPRNLTAPMPVANSWQTHFAEGLRTSIIRATHDVRELSTEVLSLDWWQWFLTRTWSDGFDDTRVLDYIRCSNARKLFEFANSKAEGFTLTVEKGQQIGLQTVFVAPDKPAESNVTPAAYAPFNSSPPLMFNRAAFSGISGNLYRFELQYGNNHLPDGPLDGTKNLAGWDAGVYTARARFTFNARGTGEEPLTDGGAVTVTLTNGVTTRVLTLASVVPNNPDDGGANPGQSFLTYDCLVMGTAALAPVTVA